MQRLGHPIKAFRHETRKKSRRACTCLRPTFAIAGPKALHKGTILAPNLAQRRPKARKGRNDSRVFGYWLDSKGGCIRPNADPNAMVAAFQLIRTDNVKCPMRHSRRKLDRRHKSKEMWQRYARYDSLRNLNLSATMILAGFMSESVGRVFLLESRNPHDLLNSTGETKSLGQLCNQFGHDFAPFFVRDKEELKRTLSYISSLDAGDCSAMPLFVHISAHGNSDGLAFGGDFMKWPELASEIIKMFRDLTPSDSPYDGPIVLVLSSCGSKDQRLTERFMKFHKSDNMEWPPEYVFVFDNEEVAWRDAVVIWALFYRMVPQLNFLNKDGKSEIQSFLKKISKLGLAELKYLRWDRQKKLYMKFSTKKTA